jgi:hypothetical protein
VTVRCPRPDVNPRWVAWLQRVDHYGTTQPEPDPYTVRRHLETRT